MNYLKSAIVFLVLFSVCHLISCQKLNKEIDCKCRLPIQSKIVGGKILKSPVPWAVSLAYDDGMHFCGGTIVNHNYIMTVEECVKNFDAPGKLGNIRIRFGTNNLDDIKNETIYKAKRLLHGLRFIGKYPNEINSFALIETDRPIDFVSNKIEPACLSTAHRTYDSKEQLSAVGWGGIKKIVNSPYSNGPVVLSKSLKQAYFYSDETMGLSCDKTLICVKPFKEGDSVCKMDIGSSLMRTEKGITTVIGSSEGVYGHEINPRWSMWEYCYGPSYFNRVSYHIPVLQSVVGDDFCSK